jgi:hypothetical protein
MRSCARQSDPSFHAKQVFPIMVTFEERGLADKFMAGLLAKPFRPEKQPHESEAALF